ncbi:RNA-dependent RNA polymerase [Penicillium discovirus]|uniref:RNA-directed RNA polymerase L n=1 Tax=Penicillium discovirus TaxID=2185132 RepID=A0A4Y1LT99_9VIRU|nr:RNA-dependent RNA polymerase [Penicillium discovirus]AWN00471.1 RNA-dependent RNA polymerase [Penicillium discovirus]
MYRTVTSTIQATSVISSNISRRLGASADLDRFSVGAVNSYIPKTLSEYQQYRRFMHDILCLGLIDSKHYSKESLTLSAIGLVSSDKHLMSLKPDLYSIENEVLRVCEVSLTYNHERMSEEKNSKYNELFSYIENNSVYIIQYTPLVVDLTDAEWEDSIVKIPDSHLSLLKRFVENLVLVHSTPEGDSFRQQVSQDLSINFPFTFDHEHWNSNLLSEIGLDPHNRNYHDAMNILREGYGEVDLGAQDVLDYLDTISNTILTMDKLPRPFPHPEPKSENEFLTDFESFTKKEKTTSKLPVVLQLGAPQLTDEIETPSRSEQWDKFMCTKMHGGYVDHILSTRTTKEDFVDYPIIKLNLTENELSQEMMQGPGRKKYIKQNNLKVERKAPTHIGLEQQHEDVVGELIDLVNSWEPSEFLIQNRLPDSEVTGNNLHNLMGKSIEYLSTNGFDFILQFYTRITREIILNSMRRRKQREYVLAHSGFDGIWILIAPGPQLRTESNVEFIKIISSIEPLSHILSREWKIIGNHWESDWLSVDTDRLKHWARSRARVNLSLLGSAEKLIEPEKELAKCIKEEINHGNYGLMSLIYLEDKAGTSTTIQTTRYVMMKSLGDKQLKGLMGKFPQRVSSVIQSLVLQRTVRFSVETCSRHTSEFIRQMNVKRDQDVGTLDETTTGVVGKVPRIFTSGDYVPIKYTFNEIYWCMMYNKDRQNKTQDSMKILGKIAKEEVKFRKELSDRSDYKKISHLFGDHTTKEDIDHITSENPESHYFSLKAVSLGIALQDSHSENFAPRSSWLTKRKMHDLLNKNLADYATFKASVKEIKDLVEIDDVKSLKEIGSRTMYRAHLEIVHDEKLYKACEVAMSFSGLNSKNYKTVIQIFKKNQIGGVREILILYIKARILINLSEEICRLLSKSDKRETLTKGKDKRLMMRGDYEELSSTFPEGTPLLFIKNSYDMATWCQKFLPTIFLPIYNQRSKKLEGMLNLCQFVMISHCMKEIEFPQKLVEQWMKHKDVKHSEPHLQHYKEEFLKTLKPKMTNMSNMGQGILHYNSTVLALSCQSLRDKLFLTCLKKLGRPQSIHWKTRVGSDDKGDTIAMDLTYDDCVFQARLFEQCAAVSERLHAMELSIKSASGHVIYEFNSAYMANLEVQSPVVKFTMAACDMIGTDSCTQFVNESYSRIRQLRENGGTSFLCMMAHYYNKIHFEEIFRTGDHMTNDPSKIFNLPRELIPYDFGNYPIYDADVQDMIGPEFHNYMVFTDKRTPQDLLKMLYTSSINIQDDGNLLPDSDEGLFKKDSFNISQGLVKQLENMKSRLNLSAESIEKYLNENPFLIIRGPMSPEETAIVIASKLYTRGAATSLRRTSPVIYLGRLSAFESATAWSMMTKDEDGTETKLRMTFREYIEKLRTLANEKDVDIQTFKSLIFPQHNSFEVVRSYTKVFGMKKQTMKLFSQSIRSWVLNNYNYNFYHSLKDILETSFGTSNKASRDDVMELRKTIPFDITSYESFIENCRLSGVKPLDLFYYMTKFYKSSVQKKAQVFACGPSTSSLNLTLSNIKRYNHLSGAIMEMDFEVEQSILDSALTPSVEFDRLKLAFNLLMLEIQGSLKVDGKYENVLEEFKLGDLTLKDIVETTLRGYKTLNKLDSQMRKICIMLASKVFLKSDFIERLLNWEQLCYTYIKKQRKDANGQWSGNLEVLVNYSNECFTFNQVSGHCYVEVDRINDLRDFQHSLYRICKIMQVEYGNLFTIRDISPLDIYSQGKILYQSRSHVRQKLKLNINYNPRFKYSKIKDLSIFTINYEMLKDESTQIVLRDNQGRKIVVSHYPGHYYPVEIPKRLSMNENIFVNGLRVTKLFKQRQWFFNGRLFPFNGKEAVSVLQNDIRPSYMKSVATDTKSKIQSYMDEYEDFGNTMMFERLDDPNHALYNDEQLKVDLARQGTIMDNSKSIMEMFKQASNELMDTEWADEYSKEFDWDKANYDEEVLGFVKALGENQVRKAKRDFYTLTNLRLNVAFINRILDLFFKSNSIRSEIAKSLPDYALHVTSIIKAGEGDQDLLTNLRRYIIGRMSTLTGKSPESLSGSIDSLSKTQRHYNTIDRLTRYLNVSSPDLYDLLGGFAEDQLSESEEEF